MAQSSKNYWEERGAILEQLSDRRAVMTTQRMVPVYQKVLENLNALIQKLFRRYTQGSGITQEKAMELLTQKQTAEMRQSLLEQLAETSDQRLRQEIIAVLDAPAYGYRISRLQALRDAAWVSARSIAPVEENAVEARLKDLYEQGYYRTIFDAQKAAGQTFDFDLLPDDRVQAAVQEYWQTEPDVVAKNFSERVWDNNAQFGEAVRETITAGLMTGQSYREMGEQLERAVGAVQIRKDIQADGSVKEVVTGGGAVYKTMRLVRTEGNRLTGQAKLTALMDAGFEEYEYLALLETGTCKICGALDGKIFPIAQAVVGVNMHPMHPHCRCYIGPARKNKSTMTGKRGARDAQGKGIEVPADMTYQQWYEKYVAKGGKDGILKQNTPELIPITQEAIDRVPKVQPEGWTEEQAAALQRAHKELLSFVKDEPVGTEAGFALDMSGTVQIRRMGKEGSVSLPQIAEEHIVIHNHPDGLTFSGSDIEQFIMSPQATAITAVGNNGTVYLIQKTENYSAADFVKSYAEIQNRYPNMMDSPSDYAKSISSFLKGAESYGVKYFERES